MGFFDDVVDSAGHLFGAGDVGIDSSAVEGDAFDKGALADLFKGLGIDKGAFIPRRDYVDAAATEQGPQDGTDHLTGDPVEDTSPSDSSKNLELDTCAMDGGNYEEYFDNLAEQASNDALDRGPGDLFIDLSRWREWRFFNSEEQVSNEEVDASGSADVQDYETYTSGSADVQDYGPPSGYPVLEDFDLVLAGSRVLF